MTTNPYRELQAKQASLRRFFKPALLSFLFLLLLLVAVSVAVIGDPPDVFMLLNVGALLAALLVAGTTDVITFHWESKIEALFEQRVGAEPGWDTYLREWELAWPNATLHSPEFMLGTYSGLRWDEINELLEGLEADQRQMALQALLRAAFPSGWTRGAAAARRTLISPLGQTPAAAIVAAAIGDTRLSTR